uniref:Uncharacterized protein n=1 Tax=Oryza punctata TaxID=4537 RepID=A0A0E0JLQ4_ORYPU
MARWDEKNAKLRTNAYENEGTHGGVVNLIVQVMAKERLSLERVIHDMEYKLLSKILTIQQELTEIKMHDTLATRVCNLEADYTDDYILTKEDEEVVNFVRNIYIWATVADIAGIPLAINFLLPNVNGGWLYDTVIDAYGYIANIANENVGVITTFQSYLLFDEFEDFDSRFDHRWVSQVGKICVMRQMEAQFLSEFERDVEGEVHAMDDDVKIMGTGKTKRPRKVSKKTTHGSVLQDANTKDTYIVSQGKKKAARTLTKEESSAKYSTQEVSLESKTIAQRVCSVNRRMHTPSRYQLSSYQQH